MRLAFSVLVGFGKKMLDNPDPFTSRAIDYMAVFELGNEGAGIRLLHWYPVEDVLGAPLPVTELSRHLAENTASSMSPSGAICFALPDASGVLFFGAKVVIESFSVVALSRMPHLRLMRDALNMLRQAVTSPAKLDLEPLVKSLILDLAHPVPDRLTLVNWENLGELVIGMPMAKSLPHVDDEGFTLLFNSLSLDQVITVYEALLSEENICFVSTKREDVLTMAVEACKSLTYPLVWQGAYQVRFLLFPHLRIYTR